MYLLQIRTIPFKMLPVNNYVVWDNDEIRSKLYSRGGIVFVGEHYFATKLFVVVHEAFSNACSDKGAPNKKAVPNLVTKFLDTGCVCP
jgi:hypothetical protein